ncbi:hypothetical protein R6Q59_025890 [Mikania micrantha]|uniref:MADS-box domain-containing protein n=1 Tax=Mikania micrantha TaxID=192012 RepID=A0A5N6L8P2_9ASTR|nr:hypothetical protein E3N88_45819 [Mikania micrantha]
MGRVKIVMEPITNDKKRKITFNARKQGLIKKARELTTLCDVNISMIICSDDQENPEIFPPDCQKLNSLIDLYKRNRGMDPQRINFYAISDYLMDRKMKIEEELVKAKKKNLEAKYPIWFDFLNNASELQLREFAFGLENKILDVKSRIESIKNFVLEPVRFYGVEDNRIMQSWNPNLVKPVTRPIITPSSYPDLLPNMMVDEYGSFVYEGHRSTSINGAWFPPDQLIHEYFLVSDFAS